MKILSYFLIIIGSILLLTPFVGNIITDWHQEQLIQEYNESLTESFSQNVLAPEPEKIDSPSSEISDSDTKEKEPVVKVQKPKSPVQALGRIRIPKINLDLPIVKGVEKSSLRLGIGYMTESDPLGQEGNAVLAGHRNYPFGQMFSRLDELQLDDEVIIEANKKKYSYVVYEKLVVEPDDVSVIRNVYDRKVLTLVTCTPRGKDTQRLIIHASID